MHNTIPTNLKNLDDDFLICLDVEALKDLAVFTASNLTHNLVALLVPGLWVKMCNATVPQDGIA